MKTRISKKQLIDLLNDLEYENKTFYYHQYDLDLGTVTKRRCINYKTILNEIDELHTINLYHNNKKNNMYVYIHYNVRNNDINTGQLIRLLINPKPEKNSYK